jgi:hypothetical protein
MNVLYNLFFTQRAQSKGTQRAQRRKCFSSVCYIFLIVVFTWRLFSLCIFACNFRYGCHIDVDVYESAKGVVEWLWHRLKVGGIIVFDDFGFNTCNGVTKFVNEQKLLDDRVVIHNLNGHAVMVKIF